MEEGFRGVQIVGEDGGEAGWRGVGEDFKEDAWRAVRRKAVESIPEHRNGGRTQLSQLLSAHSLGTKTLSLQGSPEPHALALWGPCGVS